MGKFKDALLGLVIEVEEVPDAQPVQQAAPQVATTFKHKGGAKQQEAAPTNQPLEPAKGLPSINLTGDKFLSYLRKKIEDNDLPGPDFLEFVRVANGFDDSLDKAQCFKLAFQSIRSMYGDKFNKDTILKSIDFYVQLIASERSKVEETVKNERAVHVEGAQKQIADIDARIAKLQAEIETLNKQREPIQSGVSAAEERIKQFEENAMKAIDEVVEDLKANKVEINSIL